MKYLVINQVFSLRLDIFLSHAILRSTYIYIRSFLMSSAPINLEVRDGKMYLKNLDWDGAVDAQGKRAAEDAEIILKKDGKGGRDKIVAKYWSAQKNVFVEKELNILNKYDQAIFVQAEVDMNIPGKAYDGIKENVEIHWKGNLVEIWYGLTNYTIAGQEPSKPTVPEPQTASPKTILTARENAIRNERVKVWAPYYDKIKSYREKVASAFKAMGVDAYQGQAKDKKYFDLSKHTPTVKDSS
jgi:hypothetical protein